MTEVLEMTLAERMLYCTVKINTVRQGSAVGSGTGFFWQSRAVNDRSMFLLVTNKHVLEGADSLVVIVHMADASTSDKPSGQFANCRIELSTVDVFPHPNPAIDLVGLNFTAIINEAVGAGTPLFIQSIAAAAIPSEEDWSLFDAFEEVLMIGCPRGIYDQANNLPIVRRGTTATPLSKRYEGRDEFLVDMACFPGSSGSPVFMYNANGFVDRKTNTYMMGKGRFFFLGILYAGPIINNEGRIVLGSQPRIEVAAMMHLGQVMRSTMMTDIDDLVEARLDQIAASEATELPSAE
ncbi:S1 family peptidase [Sphingomonas jaspsi]|uniref:S1 family peptidase n=1 Tax=Sphingomonas jaspsi TaxID=392409 RepID=UPI0004AC8534|nr:serine protease [Sphingomonas jaspsi]